MNDFVFSSIFIAARSDRRVIHIIDMNFTTYHTSQLPLIFGAEKISKFQRIKANTKSQVFFFKRER